MESYLMSKKNIQPDSFKQAFDILKANAQTLEDQVEPDIDNLMQLVEQSMQAYRICKARIDAVQAALEATFEAD